MEKAAKRHARRKRENLCKKHSLSHNIGAIEAILQRRYDKHSVNGMVTEIERKKHKRRGRTTRSRMYCTYGEEKQTADLCGNSYASFFPNSTNNIHDGKH